MKKQILTLIAGLALSTASLIAQNDNGLIGKARGAAHDCLNDYSGPNWEIHEGIFTVSSCFAGGFIKEVIFSAAPIMPPCDPEAGPCPVPLPAIVAIVQFGCNGEIISNSCY